MSGDSRTDFSEPPPSAVLVRAVSDYSEEDKLWRRGLVVKLHEDVVQFGGEMALRGPLGPLGNIPRKIDQMGRHGWPVIAIAEPGLQCEGAVTAENARLKHPVGEGGQGGRG